MKMFYVKRKSKKDWELSIIWITDFDIQAFTPGGCYSLDEKYCPQIVSSCLSNRNLGYNWTLKGKLFLVNFNQKILNKFRSLYSKTFKLSRTQTTGVMFWHKVSSRSLSLPSSCEYDDVLFFRCIVECALFDLLDSQIIDHQ